MGGVGGHSSETFDNFQLKFDTIISKNTLHIDRTNNMMPMCVNKDVGVNYCGGGKLSDTMLESTFTNTHILNSVLCIVLKVLCMLPLIEHMTQIPLCSPAWSSSTLPRNRGN